MGAGTDPIRASAADDLSCRGRTDQKGEVLPFRYNSDKLNHCGIKSLMMEAGGMTYTTDPI